jgi:hypothetical protein
MNEKIKQLAIKAGFPEWSHKTVGFELEQFAELIIKECTSVVAGGSFLHDQAPTAIFAKECSGAIKRHFGVKEQVTESVELHSCPYAEEIHGNYDKMCDCDEERTRQCAMDV